MYSFTFWIGVRNVRRELLTKKVDLLADYYTVNYSKVSTHVNSY
jgi:hypothetical protein